MYHLHEGDALDAYPTWANAGSPETIISDGAYGINGFVGDPRTPAGLDKWYEPHVKEWSKHSTAMTSLWFWNTEVGWANVHPVLEAYGWNYVQACIWDKGPGHIAGRVNSKTVRTFPVVTEICVLYQRSPEFTSKDSGLSMQDWMRQEWKRTGLPFSEANKACGVKNAASRKYFASDHLWYAPPADHMVSIVEYANKHGKKLDAGEKPYFYMNGVDVTKHSSWEQLRYIWNHQHGITNVWQRPPLRSSERVKIGGKSVHTNQKPLDLCDQIIKSTSHPGGIVWDPFGGLGSFAVSAVNNGRKAYIAEANPDFIEPIKKRLDEASGTTLDIS